MQRKDIEMVPNETKGEGNGKARMTQGDGASVSERSGLWRGEGFAETAGVIRQSRVWGRLMLTEYCTRTRSGRVPDTAVWMLVKLCKVLAQCCTMSMHIWEHAWQLPKCTMFVV